MVGRSPGNEAPGKKRSGVPGRGLSPERRLRSERGGGGDYWRRGAVLEFGIWEPLLHRCCLLIASFFDVRVLGNRGVFFA